MYGACTFIYTRNHPVLQVNLPYIERQWDMDPLKVKEWIPSAPNTFAGDM